MTQIPLEGLDLALGFLLLELVSDWCPYWLRDRPELVTQRLLSAQPLEHPYHQRAFSCCSPSDPS